MGMQEPTDSDFNDFDEPADVLVPETPAKQPTAAKPAAQPADDIEIDVVDDTPERDRTARPLQKQVDEPSDEELAQYSQGVQRRIKDLTHARHDERRKREALERENQAAQQLLQAVRAENQRLKQFVQEGSKQFGEMSVAAAEAKLAEARSKLRAANESFDVDSIATAQEELANALLNVREAKNFKPPVVSEPDSVVQTQQSQSQDQPTLHPKTAAWMSRNKWFTSPQHVAATSYALGLDRELRDDGYDPRSDEYYEQVDARMKKRFPELYESAGDDTGKTQSQRSEPKERGPAVAPALRTTSKRRVTLNASQVALCKKLGITPQQYAAELLASGELQ